MFIFLCHAGRFPKLQEQATLSGAEKPLDHVTVLCCLNLLGADK
jgi:hypothetical protein